jgi:hypothetical protein
VSVAEDLKRTRAAVERLRRSIEDTITVSPQQGYAVRACDIMSDLLDLIEDDLGVGDPGVKCTSCVDIVNAQDYDDHRQWAHGDDT